MKVMFLTVGTYDHYVLTCHLNDNLSVRMTDMCLSANADESYPICLPVITDDSQCLPVGTDDQCAYLPCLNINYLFVQATVTCLTVGTDDRYACLSYRVSYHILFVCTDNSRVFTCRY